MPRSDDPHAPHFTMLARAALKDKAAQRREAQAIELRQQAAELREAHAAAASGATAVAVRPTKRR